MLLDSNLNEPASHGFVSFKVWPRNDVPLGTDVFNRAAIYFDYNPPIFTNETQHRIDSGFVTVDVWTPLQDQLELNVFPNPMHDETTIELTGLPFGYAVLLEITDVAGRPVLQKTTIEGRFTLHRGDLPVGFYLLKISTGGRLAGSGKLSVR